MIVQSSDDRGSAGLFEFQVIQSVDTRSSTVELVTGLAHTYTSGSESLWKSFANTGECVDASGGIFAKGVLSEDHSVSTCKALCESAGELCIGVQYIPSPRTVRDSQGVCILLALSGSDSSALEARAGSASAIATMASSSEIQPIIISQPTWNVYPCWMELCCQVPYCSRYYSSTDRLGKKKG